MPGSRHMQVCSNRMTLIRRRILISARTQANGYLHGWSGEGEGRSMPSTSSRLGLAEVLEIESLGRSIRWGVLEMCRFLIAQPRTETLMRLAIQVKGAKPSFPFPTISRSHFPKPAGGRADHICYYVATNPRSGERVNGDSATRSDPAFPLIAGSAGKVAHASGWPAEPSDDTML